MADKVRMTDPWLRSLRPPKEGRATYRDADTRGLWLRVTAKGVKSWSLWKRIGGRGARITLGEYPDVPLAEARKQAVVKRGEITAGKDPVAEKQRDKLAKTFGDLAESYLKAAQIRETTLGEWTLLLRHDRLAGLRARRSTEITRGDLVRLLDRIREDSLRRGGKGYSANRTLEAVRRVFSWAVQKDLLPASPCIGVIKPTREEPRRRCYTDAELGAIVRSLGNSAMADGIRICMYTGVRVEQALGAPWAEIDLDRVVAIKGKKVARPAWLIAADRTGNKSGVPWLVPLVEEAADVLRTRANDTAFVFPTSSGGTVWRSQNAVRGIRQRSGVADFRPHDLRRTLTTWLASAAGGATPQPVRDAILGHRPPRLEGTYNVHAYEDEKRTALERWARHVERCAAAAEPAKVLRMPGA
jgi:integrase